MATRKPRKFGDGGVTEGQNANIDDDTRARAMKWMQQQQESKSDSDEAPAKKAAPKATPKPAPKAEPKAESKAPAKKASAEDIPNSAPKGWKGGDGEKVDSTELGRNASALANGTGPGRLVTGLSLAAREGVAANAAQKAYNSRAALRRSGEGLNATEAAAARNRIRDASFDGGMKHGGKVKPKMAEKTYKAGGSVKGWGVARGARKAKIV